uniref:Chemokine interleukin-8-like domain-containing protein n=1 Tax=Falco tinnunculus TaxID=100819 RepID=A0A8C4UZL2_FALTI
WKLCSHPGNSQNLVPRPSTPASASHFAPIECCFKYTQKAIRHIQSFYETSSDCSLPAVICADPQKLWVKRAMKNLPRKK